MTVIAKRLEYAIGTGDYKNVRDLLNAGADPKVPFEICGEKIYPLAYAISTHETETVKALLEFGADPNTVWYENKRNLNPLEYARLLNNKEIENILCSRGAKTLEQEDPQHRYLLEFDDWIEAWTERCRRTEWQ